MQNFDLIDVVLLVAVGLNVGSAWKNYQYRSYGHAAIGVFIAAMCFWAILQ